MLLPREESPLVRALPFAIGMLIALASFAFFGWGLTHYWNPYTPHRPAPAWTRYFQYVWLLHLFYLAWRKRDMKKVETGYWPVRRTGPQPPQSENAGAIVGHRSESGHD